MGYTITFHYVDDNSEFRAHTGWAYKYVATSRV